MWPTRDPASGGRNYDLENAIRIRAGAHSFEAKVFNLVVSAVFAEDSAKALRSMGEHAERIVAETARGISLVIDPFGDVVGDIQRTEGILYRTIDTDDVLEPKQFHDISGSYNRFDIFDLHVDRRRVQPITIRPDPAPATPAGLAPYPSTGSIEPGSPETSTQAT